MKTHFLVRKRVTLFGIVSSMAFALVLFQNLSTPLPLPEMPPFTVSTLSRVDYDDVAQKHVLTNPTFSAFRLTMDGRIGFEINSNRFVMVSPEKYSQLHSEPFMLSKPNTDFLSQARFPGPTNVLLNSQELTDYNNLRAWVSDPAHTNDYNNLVNTLKTAGRPFGQSGTTLCNGGAQAYECTAVADAGKDCYDVSILGMARYAVSMNGEYKNAAKVRSRKVTIVVRKPKTKAAAIERIDVKGEVIESPSFVVQDQVFSDPIKRDPHSSFILLEPAMTDDGRLLVGRLGHRKMLLGSASSKPIDVFYMTSPAGKAACDATGFTKLQSVAYASSDPMMKNPDGTARYGIAVFRMRDGTGNILPIDADIGTYPWIDRKGDNLFLETVGSTLYSRQVNGLASNGHLLLGDILSARFPTKCVKSSFNFDDVGLQNCNASSFPIAVDDIHDPEEVDQTRGVSVIGSWTRGKLVLLDGQLNHTDYGLRSHIFQQRFVQLYQDSLGVSSGWVKIGAGRSIEKPVLEDLVYPGVNKNVLDSTMNTLNSYTTFRANLPRDVVWMMNDNQGSAEVAFDDYLSGQMYINAEMTGAVQYSSISPYPAVESTQVWTYFDGYKPAYNTNYINNSTGLPDVRIQNAATNTGLGVPSYGLVLNGRVEPIAQGGIEGKGLWFNGVNTQVQFPVVNAISNRLTFVSLFIAPYWDPADTTKHQIVKFPDGTSFYANNTAFSFTNSVGNTVFTLPKGLALQSKKWTHIAFQLDAAHTSVDIFINGMSVVKDLPLKGVSFQIVPGTIQLGGTAPMKAWIDNFKVTLSQPVAEVVCNMAYGSLYYVLPGATEFEKQASLYPTIAHQSVLKSLSADLQQQLPANASFICKTDYTSMSGIYKAKLYDPSQLVSVRDNILFRYGGKSAFDGTLHWNLKRADFTNSSFCLSCHAENMPVRGLQLTALAPGANCALKDARRQPFQAPKLIKGIMTPELETSIYKALGVTRPVVQPSIDYYALPQSTKPSECY